MMKRFLFLVFVLSTLVTSVAQGTVVEDLSLAQMTERAHWIVRGTINGTEARWLEVGRRGIFTQVELELLEVLKGPAKAGETMTFEQFGGTVDGITHKIPGAPHFALGEEVLLFLSRHQSGRLYVVGFSQGKFTVSRERKPAQLSRDLGGIHRVPTVHPYTRYVGHEGLHDLSALRRTIQNLVEKG